MYNKKREKRKEVKGMERRIEEELSWEDSSSK